ncbi:TrlF family AAA-like ATPase [Ramlibacter sp.]|uniref:TrlF family AAA-like ATPase n=1 Tax=Ramlibacter sp. TaxID=1917967 RepID=UPI003D119D35
MTNITLNYPGSRWWKFDFHTHTPASTDTPWHREGLDLTPPEWLLKYMAAEVDCVAVTDHNSGAWIDRLKAAYAEMKSAADQGRPPTGFRELTLFPGVELSVQGGVHVLALFEPDSDASRIDSLLGRVDYDSSKGDREGQTRMGLPQVIEAVLSAGGIPIPAHADAGNGLLRVKPGTRQCALSAAWVTQALEVNGLLAIEWCDTANPVPQAVQRLVEPLARVLGSDCHSFRGANVPGTRFTWVKMASPTLEGLRLALLDGNDVSVRRSEDSQGFDPFHVPAHMIEAVEILEGRVIGRPDPVRLTLTPYFNAIVGGRGTGKSTIVHALRLATRRELEVTQLPDSSGPRDQFTSFRKGALTPKTEVRVEWANEDLRLRLRWREDGQGPSVEEWDGAAWRPSASQSINPSRFPVRIFSQGQIAALAGSGRQSLLKIVDEAAGVEPSGQAFEEARRTLFTLRARLRELDGKLGAVPELERKRQEVERKLGAFVQADHAAVLQSYARGQQQNREVESTLAQLRDGEAVLREAAERLVLDDWPPQHFASVDVDILAWRSHVDRAVQELRARLQMEAQTLKDLVATSAHDERVLAWRARVDAARAANAELQIRLAEQGVGDPQAFARLTQEGQQLEEQLKSMRLMAGDRDALQRQIESQQTLLLERRQAITNRRKEFVARALQSNEHVRITVVPFGFDARRIARELRELIDAVDERFADDILASTDGEPSSGLAWNLAQASEGSKLEILEDVKRQLTSRDIRLKGHFRNYLERKNEKPEFADHLGTWFPQDDLRIEYWQGSEWKSISEGSQGQRSAALLAFLLAFGEEPLVLDQPEDDLDNHLIYDLIVRQIRENKLRRQLIVVTHNANVVVNGDAEMMHVMEFSGGQCRVMKKGSLQDEPVREEVCRVMEGGREAFSRRWKRLGRKA